MKIGRTTEENIIIEDLISNLRGVLKIELQFYLIKTEIDKKGNSVMNYPLIGRYTGLNSVLYEAR